MSHVVFDALIVGSGASGMFAAQELTAQGLNVVQFEGGPPIGPEDFDPNRNSRQTDINLWQRAKAVFSGQSVQARNLFFDARQRHLFVNDRESPYETPPDAPYMWIRGHQAGGRTHTFGRVLMRWTDHDFRVRSRTGQGFDWPISYSDLSPYYEEVERALGLYGQSDGLPTLPDSIYAYESKFTEAELLFKKRVEDAWPERRIVTWRYIGPEPTRVLAPLRNAIASGHLTIQYNSIVGRILTDTGTGRAVGAEVIDRHTQERRVVKARSVVLCASPIESIRLLLNSGSERHPNGLANSSNHLGRYFMDQLPCVAGGTFRDAQGSAAADTAPSDPFYGPSGGVFIPRSPASDRSGAGNWAFQGSIGRNPTAKTADARFSFMGYGIMQPNLENCVRLSRSRKDAWGVPVPYIRCKISNQDRDTLGQGIAFLSETLERAGCQIEFLGSPLGLVEKGRGAYPDSDAVSRFIFRRMFPKAMVMGIAIHEAGGARMGADPGTSILNEWNRSWDVPNLYVTDASAFPSSGVSGTSLTIMAMTVRACRHLANELRTGIV